MTNTVNTDLFMIFSGISVLAFMFYRNSTKEALKIVRIRTMSSPFYYAIPPRWLRKIFSLPKKEMRKYLIIRLYFAIIHALLAVINFLIYLCSGAKAIVAGVLIMIQICWILSDTIFFLIYLHINKK